MDSVLITGAAGFIGCNAAARYASKGCRIVALDDLSRNGSRHNARWLEQEHGIEVEEVDVRDRRAVERAVREARPDAVLHLAAQVAVTSSMEDPRKDFEVNAGGTLNVLEAVRHHAPDAHVLYASTNKVYGDLSDVDVVEKETRYEYRNHPEGIDEKRPLDFRTPYGCSQGAADQYVLDWAETYGLTTTSIRQSCIYGPRQMGVEAQGWVAWFVRAALSGRELTIYGDGKQVRDLLYIDDLIDLFDAVIENPDASVGEAFNAGGGREYSLSLLELLELLEEELGREVPRGYDEWRPGDQKVFYCNVRKAFRRLDWRPKVEPSQGVDQLVRYVRSSRWMGDGDWSNLTRGTGGRS